MASAGRNRRRHRQRWCGLLLLLLLHHTDGLGWMCLRAPEPEAVAGMVERPNLPNPRDLAMKLGPAALRHHPHSPVPRRRKPHINPLACLGLVHTVWPRRLRRVPEDAGRSAGAVRPLRGLRTRKECGSASAGARAPPRWRARCRSCCGTAASGARSSAARRGGAAGRGI